MRHVAVSVLVALALAAAVVGVGADATADSPERTMIRVADAEIWPYVGPDPSFDRRASSINVVVRDDPERVRRYLAGRGAWNRSDPEWVRETPEEPAAVADERVPWRDAPGAPRYVYVADRGWTTERYQLHRGTYFGSRDHLRAYGPASGDWTAVQAHAEHWDWFTITHTVDSVEDAQRRVEAAFLGEPGFEVRRVYHANGDTYDADGWTTVVGIALAPLVGRRTRRHVRSIVNDRNRRRLALAGTLTALPLVVRFGGIFCERSLPWLSSDAVVAVWYPVLVAGVPLAAVALGRRLPSVEAGALAAVGFGTGVLLDYAYLGAEVVPVPVAVHRVAVVAAVGLLAAGASDGIAGEGGTASLGTPTLRAGALLWVAAVVAGHLV